jgi:nucleoside-diphosphate-sugar epimerase
MGCEAAKTETFNLTYGDARSILDLVEMIRAGFPDAVVEFEERDKLQPFRGTLSIEKARRVFGYNPTYPIEKGVAEYIAWYRNYHHDVRTAPVQRTPRLAIVSPRKPVELAPKTFGGSELFW